MNLSCAILFLCAVNIHSQVTVPSVIDLPLPRLNHDVSLPTDLPLIIAHRGASGSYPEHTVPAYRHAIDEGADVVECDLSITKDLRLVCLHDPGLRGTTDVVAKYPSRHRKLSIFNPADKRTINRTDFYTFDFTLEEIKNLTTKQAMNFRNPNYNSMYQVPTFEEYIRTVKAANRSVGLHIETKVPELFNRFLAAAGHNQTLEQILVKTLRKFGYVNSNDPCFIQSFDMDSLKRLKNLTDLPLVLLTKSTPTDSELDEWKNLLYGLGPSKTLIVPEASQGYLGTPTDLLARAHSRGLKVHAWTFRNEDQYLWWNYQQDPVMEYTLFLSLGLDGFFTDFPGTLSRFYRLKEEAEEIKRDSSAAASTAGWTSLQMVMCVAWVMTFCYKLLGGYFI